MNTDSLISLLIDSYELHGAVNLNGSCVYPNRQNVIETLLDIQSLLFPGFARAELLDKELLRFTTGERIHKIVARLSGEIQKALCYQNKEAEKIPCFSVAEHKAVALLEYIVELRSLLIADMRAAMNGDPAAFNSEEIILSYPGFEAVTVYRIAHFLHKNGVPIIPRIMSEYVHGKTGIDIHPGAEIGTSFFIDHGTGVVIGETTHIGDRVKMYQGVTLGALSVKKEMQNTKRHPTIEDDVTIYAGATILGGNTIIGKNSIIGGNTWVTSSVPPNSVITISRCGVSTTQEKVR